MTAPHARPDFIVEAPEDIVRLRCLRCYWTPASGMDHEKYHAVFCLGETRGSLARVLGLIPESFLAREPELADAVRSARSILGGT